MITERIETNTEVITFESLEEFYDYCLTTPINSAFQGEGLLSVEGTERFTGTKSFAEAVELLKNGWDTMAQTLVQRLNVVANQTQPATKQKSILGVAGYQAIVPMFLINMPNNMLNKKAVPIKQKVITLTKSISYSCNFSKEIIEAESIKALQIVKKLEAQGYRVNLNILFGARADKQELIVKVRIKSANEKLNISKVAFPLVHPSMLRRLFFRFVEVFPNISKGFVNDYGTPIEIDEMQNTIHKTEYLIPKIIRKDITQIKTINDLANLETSRT